MSSPFLKVTMKTPGMGVYRFMTYSLLAPALLRRIGIITKIDTDDEWTIVTVSHIPGRVRDVSYMFKFETEPARAWAEILADVLR